MISAGHGPTLLYRAATGEVTIFGGDGLPLGVSQQEHYGPTTVLKLETGDVLLMSTDGFFEGMRHDDESFGIERLCNTLRDHASKGDAASTLAAIDDAVRTFCDGTPQADDMTAIVIRRLAPVNAMENS
jgi:phosphoserine phosphatase RsbU/P